jgi:FkbM family methyltransferase
MIKQFPALSSILPHIETLHIVDVGANPIDGKPPYINLIRDGRAKVIGFEPNTQALSELNQQKGDNETYLPYALADGEIHTLHLCAASGMTSLLKPNFPLLSYFHGFTEWAAIKETLEIKTHRLDDLSEIHKMDYLKIDVQGAELMIFQHGTRLLKDCMVIHTEVEFLPMYENQPLFSEVEQFLRSQGFVFHRFVPLVSRIIKPLMGKNIYAGLSQLFWADALFIKDFTRLDRIAGPDLLKFAHIMHDVYQSYDIVLRILVEHDKMFATAYQHDYIRMLKAGSPS